MHADHEWITAAYDNAVAESGEDALHVKESRGAVAEEYESAIQSGELTRSDVDLYAEGLMLFDQFIRPERQARKARMQSEMEHIALALNGGTILGLDDPALKIAYPLGDGRDKILLLWSAEDWRSAALTRFRKAAESTASAAIFDELAAQISDAIIRRGIRSTGELFDDGLAS